MKHLRGWLVIAVTWAGGCGDRSTLYVVGARPASSGSSDANDAGAGHDAEADGERDAGLEADVATADAADAVAPIDAAMRDASPCPDGGATAAYLWGVGGKLYTFDPPTLATRELGQVTCPTTAVPWTLSVSRTGFSYMLYADWRIYRVDLTTLACVTTPFATGQLGFATGQLAIAVSRDPGAERLYVYGMNAAPTLAVTDLTRFVLSPVGTVAPDPGEYPVDMQADAFGRLYALSRTGLLIQLDSSTARVLARDQTGYQPDGSWAIMTWNDKLYFFAGSQVSRYDPATKQLTAVGQVSDSIIGASAAACIH